MWRSRLILTGTLAEAESKGAAAEGKAALESEYPASRKCATSQGCGSASLYTGLWCPLLTAVAARSFYNNPDSRGSMSPPAQSVARAAGALG